MNRTELLKKLDALSYDRNEYWLAAGGAMVFYGFREETGDVDLGCTKKMADELEAGGCPLKMLPDGTRKFSPAEDVEIFEGWIADRAEMHDGVPVVSVKGLIEMKQALGREKDMRDIRLIEEKMESVRLTEITQENLDEVLSLTVAPHQQRFVSSTACSLAQAYVYQDTAYPFAIYAGNIPVGFVMLGYYEARDQYTLWKFLIDHRYQHRGYGRKALLLSLEYLIGRFGVSKIYTGVSVGNETAKQLYLSVGFKETGLTEHGMEELKYTVE